MPLPQIDEALPSRTEDSPAKILAADDDPGILSLLKTVITSRGYLFTGVTDGGSAMEKMRADKPDLVMLDYSMPVLNGPSALAKMRAEGFTGPVIFLSAKADTSIIAGILENGADDYISKPFQPHELLARVQAHLRIKTLSDKLLLMADTDDVSGLLNMRAASRMLEHEIEAARRYERTLAAIMLDLDDFKSVNDDNGHLFGTWVLSRVGALLRETIRKADIAARYGGDEFLIILSESSLEGARFFGEKLCGAIASAVFEQGPHRAAVNASAGAAIFQPQALVSAESVIREADRLLYEAKRSGKNRCITMEFMAPPDNPK
ncbi:MAG: diguanylate cyclase [Elusimicrobiales bacterium]|nr:diguanylate cyclase [Elusimicrobiales bacterium]